VVKGKVSERFSITEVGCPIVKDCHFKECRYWIPVEYYDYCLLNVDKEHQCHEIGDLTGISRQAISETEKRGGRRFIRKAKALRLPTKLEGWLVDKEIPVGQGKTSK